MSILKEWAKSEIKQARRMKQYGRKRELTSNEILKHIRNENGQQQEGPEQHDMSTQRMEARCITEARLVKSQMRAI